MLAATAAVTGIMSRENFLKEMEASFAHKFAKKPEVIKGNMAALEMAYDKAEIEMAREAGSSEKKSGASSKEMKRSA
jgi:Pyruvate/2-oxoacid:ferredoxin oxidoreductase gamma subunit